MTPKTTDSERANEMHDQVVLLHALVNNGFFMNELSDFEALNRGLYKYAMTRGFTSIEEIDEYTMRVFLYWIHKKNTLNQKEIGKRIRFSYSQSYVSEILSLFPTHCKLPSRRYQSFIDAYQDSFQVGIEFDFKAFGCMLDKIFAPRSVSL